MFKVENLVDNLAFWLSFIRELVDTLLSPPGQYPLSADSENWESEGSIHVFSDLGKKIFTLIFTHLKVLEWR